MRSWINHFALNLGSALASLFYAVIPPQWTGHTKGDLESLEEYNPWMAFVDGLGLVDTEKEDKEDIDTELIDEFELDEEAFLRD